MTDPIDGDSPVDDALDDELAAEFDAEASEGDGDSVAEGDAKGIDGDDVVDAEVLELLDELEKFGVASSAEELLTSTIGDLERVTAERDEYLDLARRVQADFENYKRRIDGQRIEQTQRAAEALVVEILPVLDACDAAVAHGAEDVGPIQSALFTTLEKRGLAKLDDIEVSFDPLVHEAVLTEDGEGAEDGPLVTEILRSGYSWNGRVVRPAMVKVRG